MKEVMYKLLIVIVVALLSACQQLQHGQIQPVKLIGTNKYLTTCSGAVEAWGDCYAKAKLTCDKGYNIISAKENAQGGIRTFEFQCKK